MLKSRKFHSAIAVAIGALSLGVALPAMADDPIKIGFVTHAQGNPFIQQIVDGAQAAAKDLGVELVVSQESGGDPEAQLRAVQNFVNSGVKGVAIAEPGGMLAEMDRVRKDSGCRYDAVSGRLQDALADTAEVPVVVRVHDQACRRIG